MTFEEGLREFERDGRAAERFLGIAAAVLVGIEDGEGSGSGFIRLSAKMMVGDDEVEAEALRGLGLSERAHAGVDGDDEADALGIRGFKHAGLQAVAFAQTMRNMEANRAAEHLDCGLEQHNGGGAVDVVVAVEEDWFAARDGGLNAFDCGRHAQHQKRIVKLGYFRIEKREGFGWAGDAAGDQ